MLFPAKQVARSLGQVARAKPERLTEIVGVAQSISGMFPLVRAQEIVRDVSNG
jgi:hypothetical protein